MWRAAIAMLLAVPLPVPFGDAEASALSVAEDGSVVLEVTVEVSGSPAAVLVRGVGQVDELPPIALLPRGDGIYGGIVELATTSGVLLGFEYLPAGGGDAILTDLFTLVELGVDPAVLTGLVSGAPSTAAPPTTPAPVEADEADDAQWGWLALGAGAGGLALILVWFWMGRTERVDKSSGIADNSTHADQQSTGSDGSPVQ